ncbi:putative lipid II flippase FtsW [Methyloversatilis sp.]|uniref:putative lipid II flippase FtsW n=1 Tax=Methyloversatilis sp. TaxID=2569862 RepID=UPI0035B00AB9
MSGSMRLDSPRFGDSPKPAELDPWLLWPAVALLLIGLVMVYSASIAVADSSRFTGNKQEFFLVRQAVFLAIGGVAGLMAFQVPVRTWQAASMWLFLGGIVLLALVLIPGIGTVVNNSRRWINLGPVNLQPSELVKLFTVLYAASYIVRRLPEMHSFRRAFVPMALVILCVGALLVAEPDYGAFVVIVLIAFGMLFLGGINGKLFFSLGVVAMIGFALIIRFNELRWARFIAFLDPFNNDPQGKGYQLIHSLIAFGRGEWFGVGLGGSVEKLFYLPEAHTDFLLAVIGEELGLLGVSTVIALFALVVHRCFAIGRRALLLERAYAGLVAQGVGIWFAVQAFINMGVNVGILPTKGLTLPLMSYGGSGILVNCIALAIILRIDWENRR